MEVEEMTPDRSRVLLVEDDPGVREWLCDALADEGYAVAATRTGREALERLTVWRPELILFDLRMPDLDGRAFRAAQLADPRLAPIPAVVMSGSDVRPDLAQELRAAAILQKPVDLDVLYETVARCLRPCPGSPDGGW